LAEETMLHDGGDWETKHAQRVKEHKLRQEGGLIAPPAPASPSKAEEDESAVAHAMLAGLAESQLRIAQAIEHQPAPVVHVDVPQPVIHVAIPEREVPARTDRTIQRDDDHEIIRIIEEQN
ncbi:MAG: hypothetical protein L0210_09575, partial [Rhodospirillales bacterium]|nr:hypothetical protein [Rhodospirillales bacterium]